MKFILIRKGTIEHSECKDLDEALEKVDLAPGQVDFGNVTRHLNIVVYEFGLYSEKVQHYFSIFKQLYVGNAVLFASDDVGNTVDITSDPPVMFYRDTLMVEEAIKRGAINRPQVSVNGNVIWQWRGV